MTSGKAAKAARAGSSQGSNRARRAALEQSKSRRTRRVWTVSLVVVLVLGLGIGLGFGLGAGSNNLPLQPTSALGSLRQATSQGSNGPEAVPVPSGSLLAPANYPANQNTPIDGIQCQTGEQTLFHIHAHLTVFVNGAPAQIPLGIGIPQPSTQNSPQGPFASSGACFYWLHTHAPDGIIHVESPVQRTYTLGDFFDVWGQPLGPNQVALATGPVTAFFNGSHYVGDPLTIPLEPHAQIQLDVGRPLVAPESIHFPSGL